VSALPPDRITTGADERSQLNVYLYRVTPNSAWRGARVSGDGSAKSDAQPHAPLLALDLHYLLTAYGSQDLQPETLLGAALVLLQQTPLLTLDALDNTDVASSATQRSIHAVKLTPEFVSMEDLSKLWSSLQARYRLSATYSASFVVRDAQT